MVAKRSYDEFIDSRRQYKFGDGFEPKFMPDCMKPFQRDLVEWAIRKGRAAIFADCGLGKTLMQLVFARNVHLETGKPVLIATPLAVAYQTVAEATKFGIEAGLSRDGKIESSIVVTNYQKLHKFNPGDFGGFVGDEKHQHPLQLDVIERCVHLWTNPNDVVFTPFMGVGSEVYGALINQRRGIGVELKPSYYRQAVVNVASAKDNVVVEDRDLLTGVASIDEEWQR